MCFVRLELLFLDATAIGVNSDLVRCRKTAGADDGTPFWFLFLFGGGRIEETQRILMSSTEVCLRRAWGRRFSLARLLARGR